METDTTEIVAADIGGTHARYAIATIARGKVTSLGEPTTLLTQNYASLANSWDAFAKIIGRPLPHQAAIAVACPTTGTTLKLTNNPWVIQPATLKQTLSLHTALLINDFGAMGHAISHSPPTTLQHLTGPPTPLPPHGIITVIGPGTGLGTAHILRKNNQNHVIECEGGHADFSPLDPTEDAILSHLRQKFGRVSTERIASGPGLTNIYTALATINSQPTQPTDNKTLWTQAINATNPLAATALSRFCLSLGAITGDLALTQGANAVVITGGIAPRIAHLLPASGFAHRFRAKGRLEHLMSEIPVKLMSHPYPGLLGAAAAFAETQI